MEWPVRMRDATAMKSIYRPAISAASFAMYVGQLDRGNNDINVNTRAPAPPVLGPIWVHSSPVAGSNVMAIYFALCSNEEINCSGCSCLPDCLTNIQHPISNIQSLEQEWAASAALGLQLQLHERTFATSLRKLECETSDCVNKTAGLAWRRFWPDIA